MSIAAVVAAGDDKETPSQAKPRVNFHLLPPEVLRFILQFVSSWDLLSVALVARNLVAPALSLLWLHIQVFGPSKKTELLLDDRGDRGTAGLLSYHDFVRSVTSGWFALDSDVLEPLLARLGPNLQKLDLWRLRIRSEHVLNSADLKLASHLGDKLTTLDISDWNTGAATSSLEKAMYLRLQDRPGEFLTAVAKRCPNLKRLYCHETDIDPEVLISALGSLQQIEELWMGHFGWSVERMTAVNTKARYPVVSQEQMERLAKIVSSNLVELGLFQMTMNGNSGRVLAPFLEHCPKLRRLVAKRCDARHLFADLLFGARHLAHVGVVSSLNHLRLKIAAAKELELFFTVLPELKALQFLHITIYVDHRDVNAERTLVTKLSSSLKGIRLEPLTTLRLAVEVSYSTSLEPPDRDALMADLFGQLDRSFPNLEHLDFKYCGYLDSHSRHISWGSTMLEALARVAEDKVERGAPFGRVSLSAWHLESLDALRKMLEPFRGRLYSLVLRNVTPTLFDELKHLFGYDTWEAFCSNADREEDQVALPSLLDRERFDWRAWTGQVDFWTNSGWGLYDGTLGIGIGQAGAAAAGGLIFEGELDEDATFETAFVLLGSRKALAFLSDCNTVREESG